MYCNNFHAHKQYINVNNENLVIGRPIRNYQKIEWPTPVIILSLRTKNRKNLNSCIFLFVE